MKLLLLIFSCIILMARSQIHYCDVDCRGEHHIACNNTNHNNHWGDECPESEKSLIYLNKFLISYIVKLHNKKRNLIAGGMLEKFPKACHMATMQWDSELAYLAELHVKQCKFRHDKCHNTNNFKYSGQNIAMRISDKTPPIRIIEKAINTWFDEYEDTKEDYIDKYPSNYKGPSIGHFTIMVNERNTRVGCALSNYVSVSQLLNTYLFTCNYATTNIINYPVYKACNKAGEKCVTGLNSNFNNLCSIKEIFDINP